MRQNRREMLLEALLWNCLRKNKNNITKYANCNCNCTKIKSSSSTKIKHGYSEDPTEARRALAEFEFDYHADRQESKDTSGKGRGLKSGMNCEFSASRWMFGRTVAVSWQRTRGGGGASNSLPQYCHVGWRPRKRRRNRCRKTWGKKSDTATSYVGYAGYVDSYATDTSDTSTSYVVSYVVNYATKTSTTFTSYVKYVANYDYDDKQ